MEQNAHGGGRRPNYHRGRRGQDRRGSDRRTPQGLPSQDAPQREHREHVDVEQIMREIRSRIAKGSGVDITPAQIHELAARRLEAILDPRNVSPGLLDQLRKGATAPLEAPKDSAPPYAFDETTLVATDSGLVRFFRRLLSPLLKLLFNIEPIAGAFRAQQAINQEAAAHHAARDRRQAEWNALHYELLQKLVIEASRASLEMQSLLLKVESLSGKVDFNDRRVRQMESTALQARSQGRQQEPRDRPERQERFDRPERTERPERSERPERPERSERSERSERPERPERSERPERQPELAAAPPAAAGDPSAPPAPGTATEGTGEGSRRRRRRRRGRRSGGAGPGDASGALAAVAGSASDTDAEDVELDLDEGGEDDTAVEPTTSVAASPEETPDEAPDESQQEQLFFEAPEAPPVETAPEPQLPPVPAAAPVVEPTPPRDEAIAPEPPEPVDPGPPER